MPTEEMYDEDVGTARDKPNSRLFRQMCRAYDIPPVAGYPTDWGVGPFYLDFTLPATATTTSLVTDDALWGDPLIRSIFAPANGSTSTNQAVGLTLTSAQIQIVDGAVSILTQADLDDILRTNPTLQWTVGGLTRAVSLVENIRSMIKTANVVDTDMTATAAFSRGFDGTIRRLSTLHVIPKVGDGLNIVTDSTLSAAVLCRLRFDGMVMPGDELLGLVGNARQSAGGLCGGSDPNSLNLASCSKRAAMQLAHSRVTAQSRYAMSGGA